MKGRELGRVAVLMGGWSSEREISLKSGEAVLQALRHRGVDAHPVEVGRDVAHRLLEGGFQRAFVMLHGRGGEDGVIQGLLESLGIPYTGSGVLGSALSMDKLRSKRVWQAEGLPTLPLVRLGEKNGAEVIERLGLPLAVKPAREGSSIGISKVTDPDGLLPAWREAARHDPLVIAEPWIEGAEYTVGILNGVALPVIRIEVAAEFYDYHAKYRAEETRYHCPSGLSEAQEREMQQLALHAFEVLGGEGWGRVDLLRDGAGDVWLMESNTLPGMTDHSLVPMAAKAAGIDFDELVWRILVDSVEYRPVEGMDVRQAR